MRSLSERQIRKRSEHWAPGFPMFRGQEMESKPEWSTKPREKDDLKPVKENVS